MDREKVVNGKRRPCCDYNGDCPNVAYAEIHYDDKEGNPRWSNLCRKHFEQEKDKEKIWAWSDAISDLDEDERQERKLQEEIEKDKRTFCKCGHSKIKHYRIEKEGEYFKFTDKCEICDCDKFVEENQNG